MFFLGKDSKAESGTQRKNHRWFLFLLLKVLNVLTIIAMMMVGFSDRINPTEHALWSILGLGFPILLIINLGFLVFWVFFRARMVWLPLLGLLMCYVPIRKYTPFNPPKDPPFKSLKVLSYNVFMFAVEDLDENEDNPIVNYILDSKADIVCLQEADTMGVKRKNVFKRFKAAFPYCDAEKAPIKYGQTMILLSRFPILRKERIAYESEGNSSFAYIIDYHGTEVLVINNHFESNRMTEEDKESYKSIVKDPLNNLDAPEVPTRLIDKLTTAATLRAPQVETVAAYVKKYQSRRMPIILCGDFNDSPISYAHHTIEKLLTDCYVSCGNGPGISYNRSGMYFRIDHIFCSDDFKPYGAKVDNKIAASDHYPIYTWLKFTPKP